MATYYGAKYFRDASNVAEQAIPMCAVGQIKSWSDSATFSAVLTTADSIKMIRVPAGHVPVAIYLAADGDLDTGADNLAVNVGTTASATLMASGLVIGAANKTYAIPGNGGTTGNSTLLSAAVPTADYDIVITPSANATTASTGTLRVRLLYTVDTAASAVDPTNAPSVITGTQ